MSRRKSFDRVVAGLLTLAVASYWVPAAALAGGAQPVTTEIRGNIVSADGLTGIAGVSVKAANLETREIYTSSATAADGSYTLSDLPAGSYDMAVETANGLLPADAIVETTAGKRTMVSIALKAAARADDEPQPGEGEGEEGEEEPEADEGQQEGTTETPEEPEPEQQKKKKKGGGFWRRPAGATILIVAGAGLVGALASSATDNNNEPPMTGSGN